MSLVSPAQACRCVNQIDAVCQTIEKTINQAVQKTLDQLEKDCDTICSTISGKLEADRLATAAAAKACGRILPPTLISSPDVVCFARRDAVTHNKSLRFHSFLCGALGFFLPTLLILSLVANTFTKEQLGELLGDGPAQFVSVVTVSSAGRRD